MAKVRVYELAKEAGVESKEMVERLREMGYEIKSHSSSLDEADADAVRVRLGLVETRTERKRIQVKGKTTILRRRRKVVHEEPPGDEEKAAAGEGAAAEPSGEKAGAAADAGAETAAAAAGDKPDATEPAAEESPAVEEEPVEADRGEADVETGAPVREQAVEPAAPPAAEEAGKEEAKGKKEEKPAPPRRSGYARVIKRAAIEIPVEEPRRPERPARPSRPRPPAGGMPPGPADVVPRKGKKGKRFVKILQDDMPRGKKGMKQRRGRGIDIEEVDEVAGRIPGSFLRGKARKGGKKAKDQGPVAAAAETRAIKKRITVYETITVGDLAHRMGLKANLLIAKLMELGVMANLNQALDVDTATLVAADFGYEVEQGITEEQEVLNLEEEETGGEELPRPPVVTVMGHVDHGKTSILDAIRKTDVAGGEAGGITQHIGAHYVRSSMGDIVFLDTPGHEAFTEMRSRGAKVTDVVVLVVAADDGVMEQTKEAINHAKAAGVPIVVAINKIDKDNADPMRIKSELAEYDLTPEEWGGDTIFCETSAKKNIGIDELVEQILLQAEMLELKADPGRRARGWVVEAQLHKGRGPVATVLVTQGTLKVGDAFVVGEHYGRVRSMNNDKGEKVKEAGPSMPVEVHGLSGVPRAGDEFIVVPNEKMARNVSAQRQQKSREAELAVSNKVSLDNIFDRLKEEEVKELRVVLRADTQGTLEAFSSAIEKLSTDEVRVKVIHQGTGAIIESDVLLASASDALIFGFNVRPDGKTADMAKNEGVDIRYYDVIYHALDDIRNAMAGLLEPTFQEEVIGRVEVRQIFHHPKAGTIAGSYVTEGRVERNAKVRVVRDGVVVHTGAISSLKRFKDDVKEVQAGYECGMTLENFNDIKPGDIFEVFVLEEVAGEL